MDNYIVSARKYRPATFRSVVGQRSLTTTLKNAIQNEKLAHAYLFCGPRGVGKTTCARIFAKTINCLSPTPEGEACNECESCRSFNENRSYNIHELDAASNNSVDDIRSLIEQVRIPPQIGKYKVYIIDEVHMLSAAAFNAFLKTLEEPPHHAIFVLATTEKHKILPTILSRCQIYDFNRIGINDTVEHLRYVAQQEQVHAEPEALNIIAQKADGGMRDALSIFDQVVSFTGGNITYQAVIENLNVLDYEYYFKMIKAVLQQKIGDCLLILNEILSKGFDGQHILSGMASFFRDILVCKDPQTIILFEVGDAVQERYLACAKACENKFLYKAIELTNSCDLGYKACRNKRLSIELLLIQLCQLNDPEDSGEDKKKTLIKPISEANPVSTPLGQQGNTIPEKSPDQNEANIPQSPISSESSQPTAPKKEIPRSILSVSIKNPKKNVEDQQKTSTIIQSENLQTDFSEDELIQAWKKFAEENLKTEPFVRNTMIDSPLKLNPDLSFEVCVFNQEGAMHLQEKSMDILNYLRTHLKNSAIRMNISIDESNSIKIAVSDKEKLELLIEENNSLIDLIKEFNLQIY